MSRKFWHMLLNLCLHICLTFGVFAGGINQTRLAGVCQAVSARAALFRRFLPANFKASVD